MIGDEEKYPIPTDLDQKNKTYISNTRQPPHNRLLMFADSLALSTVPFEAALYVER